MRSKPARRRVSYTLILLILGQCTGPGCFGSPTEPPESTRRFEKTVTDLRTTLEQSPDAIAPGDPRLHTYREYYGLVFREASYTFRTMQPGEHSVAVQSFEPANPRGTVLIAHGYLDHAGVWRDAIRELLAASYAVVIVDFPGHGLSTGEPADIDDFATYQQTLRLAEEYALETMPGPVHLMGHSMGGGIIAEHILTNGLSEPRRAVLIAPNIRSNHWTLSRFGHTVMRPFLDHAPRLNKRVSHNEDFLEFRARLDPLQAESTPLHWFEELVEWKQRMESLPPQAADVRVIQGTDDTVTDWQYNLGFFRQKMPNVDIRKIDGGKHHLINEKPALRKRTLRLSTDYLQTE